jgi:hypothetical protein
MSELLAEGPAAGFSILRRQSLCIEIEHIVLAFCFPR